MSSIIPEGTAVRKAVQWISQMREEGGETSLATLIEKACLRFNLPPKDCDFLNRFFQGQKSAKAKED